MKKKIILIIIVISLVSSLSFFLVFNESTNKYDVTVSNDKENASILSQEIESYALKHNASFRDASMIALGAEEMVANIIVNGYKKTSHNYIDVNLKLLEDTMILRIRDDGVPFDPTKYEYDNNENYSTDGIDLIKKVTDKISYMRILNLNNTVFEIKFKGEFNY